jgi:hypothetical protein
MHDKRNKKPASSCHPVWLDLSLKRALAVEFVELSQVIPRKLSKLHMSFRASRLGIAHALIQGCILISFQHDKAFWDLLEVVWRHGCRVQSASFGLWVCERSTGVRAACTGDVLESKRVKTHMTQIWRNTARCQ